MKTYDTFFPDVLLDVPGCPPEVAIRAIRNTVIEFCEKTLINQVTQDPISLRAGLTDYDLDAPAGYRVQKVMRAWYLGSELAPVAPDDIPSPDVYNPNIAGYTPSKSTISGYTQKDSESVSFMPIPNQDAPQSITMRVALVPLRDSTKFDDFLYEQWGEYIACGAKARLMLTPGKPYSNQNTAAYNQARFMSGLNEARQRAIRGNVRSDLSVQMRKP